MMINLTIFLRMANTSKSFEELQEQGRAGQNGLFFSGADYPTLTTIANPLLSTISPIVGTVASSLGATDSSGSSDPFFPSDFSSMSLWLPHPRSLIHNFNYATFLIVANHTCGGLVLGQVMKYSNIENTKRYATSTLSI
jgi:hypothetical protein